MNNTTDRANNTVGWAGIIKGSITVLCLAMVFYHLLFTQYLLQGTMEHQITHLGFALLIVYLTVIQKSQSSLRTIIYGALLIISFIVILYMRINYRELEMNVGFPNNVDMIIGVLLIVVVLESTRLAFGWILPIISMVALIYFVFGNYLPWMVVSHNGFPLSYIISDMGIGFSGTLGIFLGVSANVLMLFMVFGGLMQVLGVPQLILELGKFAGRFIVGGPAQTAVIGSSMIGTVSGSSVANVALTGAFTIPMMKKVGYEPDMAGAIESAASNGGQITPPIMGTAAFLMVAILGVPYLEIMKAAVIPASLYYFSVFLGVAVVSYKFKVKNPKVDFDKETLYSYAPIFVIPLIVLIVLLFNMFSAAFCAFWAIVSAIFISVIRKKTRVSVKTICDGFIEGAILGSKIAVTLSCVGILTQVMITTGAGVKFTSLIQLLSGGSVLVTLLLTMIVTIILGCGMPTAAAYIVVAILVAPALHNMGVDLIQAHFFAFYFAIMSTLTPPVALTSMAAANIAGGNFWKTSIEGFKLASAGFIIPFCIIYDSAFLLQGQRVGHTVFAIISAFVGMSSLVVTLQNYLFYPISKIERIFFLVSFIGCMCFIISKGNYLYFAIGIIPFVVLLFFQWSNKKRNLKVRSSEINQTLS